MTSTIRILHLEDSPLDAELINYRLKSLDRPWEVIRVTRKEEFASALTSTEFDLILCDNNLPGYDGVTALKLAKSTCPNTPVIMISGTLTEDGGVESMKLGATDYLLKERMERLVPAINRALAEAAEQHKRREAENRLIESEERFSKAFDYSSIGIALVAVDGRFMRVNHALTALVGYSAEELQAMSFQDITIPEDLEEDLRQMKRTLSGDIRSYQLEKRYFRKDGKIVWVLLSAALLLDADQQPRYFVSQIQDFTERKRAEEALRESEASLNAAQTRARLGSWSIDLGTQNAVWSAEMFRLTGREPALGAPPFSEFVATFAHPDDRESLTQSFRHSATTKGSRTIQFRLISGNGNVRWMLATNETFCDLVGKPWRIVGTLQDFTESKLAEEELQRYRDNLEKTVEERTAELEGRNTSLAVEIAERKRTEIELRKLSRAVEKSPIVVIITEANGTIEYVNPEFVRATGFSEEEAVGNNPRLLNSGTHSAQFFKEMYATIQSGKTWHGEFRNRRKTGELHWQSASIAPITDDAGVITHFVSVMEDVTERRRHAEELQNAKDAADAANTAKSMFLANMSHEIRTPMNGIIGLNYLLMQTKLSLKQRDYSSKIDSSARNLMRLINDILDFSKVEAGKVELERIEFSLDEVLANMLQLTSFHANEKKLSVKVETELDLPGRMIGDPLRLGQVLLNLVGNAIKFTQSGEIVVSISPVVLTSSAATLRFSVRDTGIGLTKKQIARIFEPFSQATSETTRKYGGTGLGLAISQRLIEMMGGGMDVQSVPDVGTTFSFTARFDRPLTATKPVHEIHLNVSGRRALIIDGAEDSRRILAETLTHLSFDVIWAQSGADAIEIVRQSQASARQGFDLVMVDYGIPDMTCVAITEQLRRELQKGVQPAFILVYNPDVGELPASIADAHFDATLPIPISRSTLFDAIIQSISKSSAGQKSDLTRQFDPANADEILNGSNILLVEDNAINQQIAGEALKMAGCNVTLAANGTEALACLYDTVTDNKTFDVILMDLQMPDMDGFEVTRRIRLEERFNLLPILAMTADAVTTVREQCLAAGMNDYLTKPIQFDELFSALAHWVSVRRNLNIENTQGAGSDSLGSKTRNSQRAAPDSELLRPPSDAAHVAPLEEIVWVDADDGVARVAGNRTLYIKLLGQLNAKYSHVADEVDAFRNRGDDAAAVRLLHTLKGVAANLGLMPLSLSASDWESGIKSKLDSEAIASVRAGFQHALAETLHAISAHMPAPVHKEPPLFKETAGKLSDEVITSLRQLARALANNDLEASRLIRTLNDQIPDAANDDDFAQVREAVHHFNFPEALAAIRRFAARWNVAV